MNSLRFARALGAAFALVLLGFVAHANVSSLWGGFTPSVTGPWLGDNAININTLWQAASQQIGVTYWPGLSVSQTTTQAGCTQLNKGFSEVKTSASTGSVCLPTAIAGMDIMIGNASGQTIDIFSSVASYTVGTADTINGTAGTSAYTNLTTGKNVECFTPQNGAWYCSSSN
jgi:hypothetical protein